MTIHNRLMDRSRRKNISIYVSEEAIKSAIIGLSGHCMITKGIRETAEINGYKWVRISSDLQTIRFSDLDRRLRYVYLTPPGVAEMLSYFDLGIKPDPFTFVLYRDRAVMAIPIRSGHGSRRATATAKSRTKANGRKTVNSAPLIQGGRLPPRSALADGGKFIGARRMFGRRFLPQAQKRLEEAIKQSK